MRPKPAPQEKGQQLNANIPLNVKEALEQEALTSDLSVSALLTQVLRTRYGIKPVRS